LEIEIEMEPECMHEMSGSRTIVELGEAGAKTSVAQINSTGQRALKPADPLFPKQILKSKLMT